MRRLNTIITFLLVLVIVCHIVFAGLMLMGSECNLSRYSAWAGEIFITIHLLIGFYLTIVSLVHVGKSKKKYKEENRLFWARRISGLAVFILFCFHPPMFGKETDGVFHLIPLSYAKVIIHILFVAAFFVHIFTNIRPMLVSMGIVRGSKMYRVLSVLTWILILYVLVTIVVYLAGWKLL